ncbi:MAG: hypothetical protein PHV62_07530 [Sulfuricurvum sp.]|nr:hypothetical protein [Sulfuricurvum sp.]
MAAIDIPASYLGTLLTEDQLREIVTAHAGCRIYIPKKINEYEEERLAYHRLRSIGMSHQDALINMAYEFDKSTQSIRNHFNKGIYK